MPRVLATQSHVVHGYVGNKAATFPLQYLGWDVDCVNSVQFSNHTGYGIDKVFGSVTSSSELECLFNGVLSLASTGSQYDGILSGYLPNSHSVRTMGYYYQQLKRQNSRLLWLMDPVMGDEDQLYVDKDVVPAYRELVESGSVDILTPNQFEMELLHGRKIASLQELEGAIKSIHRHVPIIVVTSLSPSVFADPDHVYCVASVRGSACHFYRVPLIDSYFTGVGDLFSALLLHSAYGSLLQKQRNFAEDINWALNIVQQVLENTRQMSAVKSRAVIGHAPSMLKMELRIVESRNFFRWQDSWSAEERDFKWFPCTS
ncbi:FAEL076Cp [Eremothecium gossypii FDAG1]|nr:FAEL076Cp [Eremothecium gossypii FDAG1]